jgi:hypothetical protein
VNISKNPLMQVYLGIWDCLEASSHFTSLVPAMNRIDYTSDVRMPDKPGMRTADQPQVRIIQLGIGPQIFRTSNASSIEVHWSIEIKVGDQRLEKLTELEWAIYAAMSHWQTYLRDAITWDGEKVCKKLYPMKVETQLGQQKKPPEAMGWISVWQATTDLFISTSKVKAYGT